MLVEPMGYVQLRFGRHACPVSLAVDQGYNPSTEKKRYVFVKAIELGFLHVWACTAVFGDQKLEAQIWIKLQDSISWYSRHESTLPGCCFYLLVRKGTMLQSCQM